MNELPLSPLPELPFTGERFTPECVREIWYEHWHRYAFAAPLARGRRVLDAACGEGYGSALLLRSGALQVLGIDIDRTSIAHARARYGGVPALRFEPADVTALDALPARSVDLIVSFETLEHVHAHERLLAGFARLLADDGLLLISTPDKANTTDATGVVNPHHVRELYRAQFEALLATQFPARRLYAQKLLFQSALWALDDHGGPALPQTQHEHRVHEGLSYPPQYYLAVCARRPELLEGLPALGLFGDARESVYAHYNDEVRRHIAAGHRLAQLEAELRSAQAELTRLRGDANARASQSHDP